MSEEIIRYAELRFARIDASLDKVDARLSEAERSVGGVEVGLVKLKAQLIELSTSFDRVELGLGRIEQRLGMAIPVEPPPSTTA